MSCKVTNSGKVAGSEVPQLYLSYPAAATDPAVPAKVLRYFKKFCASAAESEAAMSFVLTDRDVSNWDLDAKQWKVTKGAFKVSVGSSSQDIHLTGSVTV